MGSSKKRATVVPLRPESCGIDFTSSAGNPAKLVRAAGLSLTCGMWFVHLRDFVHCTHTAEGRLPFSRGMQHRRNGRLTVLFIRTSQ